MSAYPNPLKVGVFLAEPFIQLLDVAPVDMLAMLQRDYLQGMAHMAGQPELGANGFDIEYFFINETGEGPNQMTGGFKVEVTHSITTCPPLDILLIGGPMPTHRPSAAVSQFLQAQYGHVRAFLTVCTGFLPALHSGVIDGKAATAPRGMLAGLKEEAPQVEWTEKRWVRDGKLWSSGAVANGQEMMAAFMREEFKDKKDAVELVLMMSDVSVRGEEYGA
ncbi:MAG: hypothetical protein Q9173_001596 [Seirophora scorigena]